MIQSIWIIHKESGRNIFHKVYGSVPVDKDLLSGFLTALYSFAEAEVKRRGLESVVMRGLQWVYSENSGVLYIIAGDKTDSLEILKGQLEIVKDAFLQKFSIFKSGDRGIKFLRKWDGSPKAFKEFSDTLDSYVESWTKAKEVTEMATTMDVLEVYQHLFDIYTDALESIPFYKSPDKFRQEIIKAITQKMEKDELISKIIVTKEGGVNVLPLASMGESPNLSKSLRNLLTLEGKVLRKALGKDKLQSILNPKLLTYMKRDWKRIEELHMGEFIVKKILV